MTIDFKALQPTSSRKNRYRIHKVQNYIKNYKQTVVLTNTNANVLS